MHRREVSLCSSKDLYTKYSSQFLTAKPWEQSTCPSTFEGRKKLLCNCYLEYYTAVRMNDVIYATAGWLPQSLQQRRQAEKGHTLAFHLYTVWKQAKRIKLLEVMLVATLRRGISDYSFMHFARCVFATARCTAQRIVTIQIFIEKINWSFFTF